MGISGKLSIGVISRNGQPFIEDCLQSFTSALPSLLNHFDSVNFILVDSNSSDNTLESMLNFNRKISNKSTKVDVYLIEGYCNAAIARNIILRNSTGDFVFLCDGDILVNYNFLITASEKIISGHADAVVGQLSEKWFDSNFKFYKSILRTRIDQEQFVRTTGGLILISKRIQQSSLKYDEELRRNEDTDFALRISSTFRILAIPAIMGTHLTQPYYSNERFKTFLIEEYDKPLGTLFRKHIFPLRNLFEIAILHKGTIAGCIYILLFLFSAIMFLWKTYVPFLLTLSIVFLDLIRKLRNYPLKRFIIHRFVSPIMTLHGFFFPNEDIQNYSIKKVTKKNCQADLLHK